MEKVGIILRKPPGDMSVGEAVRHAMGAATEDFKASLFLLDGGVLLAQKGNEETLEDCLGMEVRVLADSDSMSEMGLAPADVIPGVAPLTPEEIAGLLGDCETVMIF
ncbi:MAG: DsrE family protein [Nitrospiraceae bacterium]|nr:DsrE family protein [Nitrospiraceae bacterium]